MEVEAAAVVIGAGVVGCAVAHALAQSGRPPVVLERSTRVGEGITSRNSGVVHAGLYYRPDSLKARCCVRGRELLFDWCARHGVAHRKCGKWIVGRREDEAALESLRANAHASGATAVEFADVQRLRSQIPAALAELALYSPRTGIVDPIAFASSLRAAAEAAGATFVFSAEVRAVDSTGDGWRIESSRGAVETPLVVNAAGLFADQIARLAGVDAYRLHPCRGDYFRVAGLTLPTLVYPVRPRGAPGLGVHVTIDLEGHVRLGPDARWIDRRDDFAPPQNEPELREQFAEAAAQLLSGITADQLSWDSCGIRPKLRAPDDSDERDFVVSIDRPGLVNLVGIESPGLTASLALAEEVLALAQ